MKKSKRKSVFGFAKCGMKIGYVKLNQPFQQAKSGKKMNKKQLTEVEKAWLACAIDGEGSISLRKSKTWFSPYITICNTNKAWIKKAADLVDSKIFKRVYVNRQTKHFGKKPIYEIHVTGKEKMKWLLPQILPYLIIKKQKAEEILDYMQKNPCNRKENMILLNKTLPRDSYGHNRNK